MIRLHRLSARAEVFYLNPDLIVAIDSTPDTVVTLTTHQKVLVADSPEAVVAAIQAWRASILARRIPSTPKRRSDAALTLVAATAGTPPTTMTRGERPMKVSSVIGLVVAIAGLYLGATMEGSNPMAILSPSAMLIVLGGTLGAVIIGTSFAAITNIPKMYMKAFNPPLHDLNAKVAELVGYAEAARRDGLLALDEVTSTIEDPYTKKGLQLVVDGTDPDLVADILESENDAMRKRHAASVQPFDKAGGYAPTMGIIGTVFGLIHVLGNLDKPETLGPSISAAFVATLLGVASANVIYLPISRAPEAALPGRAPRPRADRRGHPLDPGRRQPARRPGEAHHLRPAGAARRRRRSAKAARTPRRRPRNPSWPVTSDTSVADTTRRSTRTRSAGSCPSRT